MRVSQNSEHIKGIELQNLHKNFITRISVNLVDGLCALYGSKLHLATYWVYNIKIQFRLIKAFVISQIKLVSTAALQENLYSKHFQALLLHFLQPFAIASVLGCLIAPGVNIDFLLRQTRQADVFCLMFKRCSCSLRFTSTLGQEGENRKARWKKKKESRKQKKSICKKEFLFNKFKSGSE